MMCSRALVLLLVLGISGAGIAWAETRVGFNTPFTGPYAWVGEPHMVGTELAVADVNAAGGVLGERLELITADDACHPEQGPLAARKLVAYEVVVAFSATCSGAAIPMAGLYRAARIVMLDASATNPRLTEENTGVFRLVGRDDLQGMLAGNLLADRWPDKRIALAHDGSVFGKGLAEQVQKQLNRRGVKEVLVAAYAPGTLDYADLLAALRAAAVEVLYVGGYSPEIGLIARQAHERGQRIQLVAGDSLSTGEFWLIAGPGGEGTLFTSFNDPARDPSAVEIMQRARAHVVEPNVRILYSYAAVQVWKQAVERTGTLAYEAVVRALHTHEFDTVLGRIRFDEKGDIQGFAPFVWYIWREGVYVPLEDSSK